ncbi:MAG TPA: ATP-binding protein [Bryobacteraceae bacterium]|nr:ATP-binding protein [Bryobacteraceae bacterium]
MLDRKTGVVTATEVNGGYVSHEDRSGNLWFGYPPGLTKLDPTGTTHSISLLQRPDGSGPENVMVQTIYEDREGILWLATQSGLFRFDPKSEKSIVYTNRDGLADIDIRCALGDGQGNVWLSTASGLSRFDLQEKRFYNYDERDGLQGSRFLGRSCFQTRDGKLFFGGTNGFNAFYPRDILATAPEAPVVLTDFTISGRGTAAIWKPIFDSVTMKLSPKQDGFSIGFAALSYVNPSRTRYRFKLEGHETQWVQADSEHRFARYTNVPSGDYVFRVQAATDGFHWGNNEASLHLTLAPSWWNTPWGTSAILLASATLIFGAHKLRVKALEQRERRLGLLVERRTAELVEARDQAQAASRAKSKFLAHMSHELRNPLSSILLLSHLLKEEVASQEQHDYLDLIDRSGEHLLTLINDVLEVTKIESGKQEVVATPCDLVTLVQEVTDIVRVKADSKKLTLTCATTADLRPYVRTDAPKLRQVLLNLLGNAIKFTDAGGVTLRFGTIGPDDSGLLKLRFEVADTGDGIAIEDQARIFEPFVQAGKLAGQTGTGLGLTITRQFVEMMGGTIALESVPGRGSRFTVEVPSEVVPESEVAGVASVARSRFVLEPGQPECRVLVVDDEPENAMIMELMLRRAGFRVQVARSGTEGIEVFEEWNPQFIWMDLRMPEFSGAEAARHIRKLQGGREVRIAALTAAAFASERDEVMAAGMDDFVRKPYHTDEIFDCMARQLGLRYQHIQTEGHGESEAGESSQA